MSEEAQADIQKYGYSPKDMPDCFLPDNFDEIMQRIYEHGVVQKNTKCSVQDEHDKQKGESEVRREASLACRLLLS